MRRALFLSALLSLFSARAADVPGAYMRTANQMAANTYEVMISPSYVLTDGGGAYMNAELRYQPYEAFGTAFGFGAGELGFNFGLQGIFHVAPQMKLVPRFAVVGGAYFNRVASANYFTIKLAPTISHTFILEWGDITPYGALVLSPSFRLSGAANQASLKTTLGAKAGIKGMDGLQLLGEFSIPISQSTGEISIGLTYPFAAL